MFTGIVQRLLPLAAVVEEPQLRRLSIDLDELADGLELGASVAVNGVCLTVTSVDDARASFDVIHETLALTNLGDLKAGDLVNVERSFVVGAEVGGHIVSGHVACSVPVVRIVEADNQRDLYFSVPAHWGRYLMLKGYAALDGASLTISSLAVEEGEFGVSLIPETIARTTLGLCKVGTRINLEVDSQTQTVVDTVERLVESGRFSNLLGGIGSHPSG